MVLSMELNFNRIFGKRNRCEFHPQPLTNMLNTPKLFIYPKQLIKLTKI